MTALTLMRLTPNIGALVDIAARMRRLPPGGDLGYALHQALTALFGPDLAPRTFRLMPAERRAASQLLAYGHHEAQAYGAAAGLPPVGDAFIQEAAEALNPRALKTRAMPETWRVGQELDLETRVRPVFRSKPGRLVPIVVRDQAAGRLTREMQPSKGGERDVFERTIDQDQPPPDCARVNHAARATAYLDWLAKELDRGGAATLQGGELHQFSRTRLMVRAAKGDGAGKGPQGRAEGPDAVMHARITIKDPDAFAALLARGLGRHRAFGFGMMLLSPPGRLIRS